MTIKVTADDIQLGCRSSCCFCPLARAVCRALGLRTGTANISHCGIKAGGKCYVLPLKASSFMTWFDVGGDARPFSFELEEIT